MKSFVRTLILALALSFGVNANLNSPTVSLNVKHGGIGNGVNLANVNGEVKVESKVSDNLSIGVNVDNSDSPLKSVFGRLTQKFGNGNVNADLSVNIGDNAVSGDVSYEEAGNKFVASVNSNSENVVDSVQYSKSGNGWSFKPTFHLKEKNMDVEASADYSDDTNVQVRVGSDGSGKLKVKTNWDADTAVSIEGSGPDVNSMKVEVSRTLDDSNTIKPRFNMANKHLSVGWVRKLDAGRSLTVNVDPENSVGLEVEGANDEDWKATVSAPWNDFKNADVSFGRKFNF